MKHLVFVSIVALSLAACGDDSSSKDDTGNNSAENGATNGATNAANAPACDSTFSETEACGGDPTGSWLIADACAEPIEVPGCPDAQVTVTSEDVDGTLLVTDSNWAYEVSGRVVYSASIPQSCATLVGGCSGVATAFGADCTEAGDGSCDCTLEETVATTSSGTYTIENGNRAIVDGTDEWLFCVQGDGITLREDRDDSAVFVGGR